MSNCANKFFFVHLSYSYSTVDKQTADGKRTERQNEKKEEKETKRHLANRHRANIYMRNFVVFFSLSRSNGFFIIVDVVVAKKKLIALHS